LTLPAEGNMLVYHYSYCAYNSTVITKPRHARGATAG
jgi:hypothetical protein